jgi:hypothetical protein
MAAPKKVTTRVASRSTDEPTYNLLDEIIREHHGHIVDANITIAFNRSWTEDADGRLKLGQAKKCTEIERQMHGQDWVILLNEDAWERLDDAQKRALMDHELCHCQVTVDEKGGVKLDEYGKVVYRVRKHDVEEFKEIVERHGTWYDELREFAEKAIDQDSRPLLE